MTKYDTVSYEGLSDVIRPRSIEPVMLRGQCPRLSRGPGEGKRRLPQLPMPRLRCLRRMVQRLRCVMLRVRGGSIPHGGDELASPIWAVYYVLY